MLRDYWKKAEAAMKWLIPFFVAVFLLFGCRPANQTPPGAAAKSASAAAENTDAGEREADAGERGSGSGKQQAQNEADFGAEASQPGESGPEEADGGHLSLSVSEDGHYTTKEEVALYLHTYGQLPENFITKKEAKALGWEGGGLEPYAPGKCIGGSRFGNYEGLLPEKEGRVYTECDIDTLGADRRGAKRIVFSNDGLIYYTEDHYESFELLYGEE